MQGYLTNEGRRAASFRRFQELMDAIGYDEDLVPGFVLEMLGEPSDLSEKAIKQWYQRQEIPAYAVFNLAEGLGVDAAWLGGSTRVSRDRAVYKGGRFYREMERANRQRAIKPSRRTG